MASSRINFKEGKMKYWSKAALSIYRYLETMSTTLDKLVVDLSKGSNSTVAPRYHSTYFQANRIIELTERKRKVVNLKVAIEDSVSRLDKISRRIITLVYFDGVRSEAIAQLMNMSVRTFFRRKLYATKELINIMEALGYDADFFESEYFSEKWFMSVYDEGVSKGCNPSDDIPDRMLVRRVINEISKINNIAYNTYLT